MTILGVSAVRELRWEVKKRYRTVAAIHTDSGGGGGGGYKTAVIHMNHWRGGGGRAGVWVFQKYVVLYELRVFQINIFNCK